MSIISSAKYISSGFIALTIHASLSAATPVAGRHQAPAVSVVHEDGGRLDLIQDQTDPDSGSSGFVGQIVGRYKYLIRKLPGNRADIDVYRDGKRIFSVPDEEADIDGGGSWEPGRPEKGYDFYMSPNRRYLFVERGLITDLAVAELYKKSGDRWIIDGADRFDELALDAYCRSRHLDPDKLAGPSRMVKFIRWDTRHGKLYFWMSAASFWFSDEAQKGDLAAEWTGSCRLRDMQFRIISDKIYRFTKPQGLPR